MDSVFSVDDIADELWSPPAPPIRLHKDADVAPPLSSAAAAASSTMNSTPSECAFQRFLQQADHNGTTLHRYDVVAINGNDRHYSDNQQPQTAAAGVPPPNIPLDSEEYQAFLKSRLELACAAVALTRATNGKASESAAAASIGSQVSNSSVNKANGWDSSKTQVKDSGGPVAVPSLPAISGKSVSQVRSTTSGSSGEQSDDDEAEGETEATRNMDPADAKRVRRMLSNRESARRSRRKKQAHLSELETKVSQSRVENSSLLERLTEINQKYNEAAVDNRVLKADVETLRTKVKMAEESVKRVTGFNSLYQVMSDISTMGMPSFATSPPDTSADAAVPVQDDSNQHYYHSPSINHLTNHTIQGGFVEIPPADNVPLGATTAIGGNEMGRSVSMQREASVKHLQKRIHEGTSSSGTQGTGEQ